MILRNINDYEGLKIKGQNITNLRYADDTVLIAEMKKRAPKRDLEKNGGEQPEKCLSIEKASRAATNMFE
ncbi:hypothetical protein PoB_006679700 [Plakobranchus ocellatus]|uniref:Reverse transcriptase domain-containing protein n=1 Tax=Plakobranchus ocellatus TaxID=259542 RepID=A0AAV4D7R7_9GAST|nr:hypothetical protein PoB_006679700 [Plakobranchus ocellatus]